MNVKVPSYISLAAVCYATFAAFGLATWYTLLFVALPSQATPMSTLQDLLALEPAATQLKFHALFTLLAVGFALVLSLWPIATRRASLVALAASSLFAVGAWALFRSDTALLPTVAAGALAMSYFRAQPRGAR